MGPLAGWPGPPGDPGGGGCFRARSRGSMGPRLGGFGGQLGSGDSQENGLGCVDRGGRDQSVLRVIGLCVGRYQPFALHDPKITQCLPTPSTSTRGVRPCDPSINDSTFKLMSRSPYYLRRVRRTPLDVAPRGGCLSHRASDGWGGHLVTWGPPACSAGRDALHEGLPVSSHGNGHYLIASTR